jgi:hypothetical protein
MVLFGDVRQVGVGEGVGSVGELRHKESERLGTCEFTGTHINNSVDQGDVQRGQS